MITILSIPQAYTPSDNPVVWVFSSTETTQPNFSFLVELYVNGVLVGNHELFPIQALRTFFDAQDVLKYSTQYQTPFQGLTVSNRLPTSVFIKVYERYGTTPTTQLASVVTSSTVNAFKASLKRIDFSAFDYTYYQTLNASSKFLTTRTTDGSINRYDDWYLSIINTAITNQLVISITLNNATIVPLTIGLTTVGLLDLNVGIRNLFDLGLIVSNTYLKAVNVSIQIVDNGDNVISETKMYNVIEPCASVYSIYWINELGGIDQFLYKHNVIESAEIQSFSFERSPNGLNENNEFNVSGINAGNIDLLKVTKERRQLVSDFILQDEQNWLVKSCYTSPIQYLITSDAKFYNVRLDRQGYNVQQDRFEEEFSEVVDVVVSLDYKSITA